MSSFLRRNQPLAPSEAHRIRALRSSPRLRRQTNQTCLVILVSGASSKMASSFKFVLGQYGSFHRWGYPQMDGLWLENPTNMDDLGVAPFSEPPI